MSVRMTTAVWDCSAEITTVELVVLLKLADQANDEGICWPSQARMARQCRKSREHVNRTIRSLVAKGLVEVQHRAGTSSRYKLHIPCDEISHPQVEAAESRAGGGCDEDVTGGVTKNHRGCDAQITGGVTTSSHRTVSEPSVNQPVNRQGEGRAQARTPAREDRKTENRKPKAAKKKTAKGKRLVPEDFEPRPEDLEWAKARAPLIARNPDRLSIETDRFVNYHRAEGNRFADVYRAWRNWLLKAQDFARRDGAASGGGGQPRYLD